MKGISTAIAVIVVMSAPIADANVITHGNLTTDSTTNFITDTLTGRMYTRADAFNLTVADTEAAVGGGGLFEGWSIATSTVADEFIAAMLGLSSTPCDGNAAYGTICGSVTGWTDGDFGASYEGTYFDYFAYFGAQTQPFGLIEIYQTGSVRDYENWSVASSLDYYGQQNPYPINLLLYREASSVPEPGTLALLGLGLAGFAFRRRRTR